MTIDTAIRERLMGLTSVTSLVTDSAPGAQPRIFTVIFQQNALRPLIRIHRASQVQFLHLRGPIGVYMARVQVDIFAVSKTSADAVDAAVHGDGLGTYASGLHGFKGSIGSPPFVIRMMRHLDLSDGFEPPENRDFRIRRDYEVQFEGTH